MNQIRNILITGSNRGLGYTLIEQICQNNPLKLNIIMSSRQIQAGETSISKIKSKFPETNVSFLQLEIGNIKSHEQAIQELKNRNIKIDILVNNAGIYPQNDSKQRAEQRIQQTLNINYTGTVEFTKQMMQILTDDAKIIVLGSGLGKIEYQGQYLQKCLNSQNVQQEEYINDLANQFIQVGKENKFSQETFVDQPYYVSKALLHAWIKHIGLKIIKPKQNIFVVCPGWCQTDMGGMSATNTPEQGVSYIVELINQFPFERSERSGELYSFGKQIGP